MKIIYLDYWKNGISHFLRIDQGLKDAGFNTKMIHFGSWKNHNPTKERIVLKGLEVCDISFYGTRFIHKVLKKEKPHAIIMLNISMSVDRSILFSCRTLGIQSIYLMHGNLFLGKQLEEFIESITPKLRTNRKAVLIKYLRYNLPNYFYSGLSRDKYFFFRRKTYQVLSEAVFNPAKSLFDPTASDEVIPDWALVYANIYMDYFIKSKKIAPQRIIVVGNPSFDCISDTNNMEINSIFDQYGINNTKPIITYLEGNFVESNCPGWTNESRLKHLYEIEELCKKCDYRLIIKLHPNTISLSNESVSCFRDAIIVSAIDLYKVISISKIIIGHTTTALDLAIGLNKPVLIPYWGISTVLPKIFPKDIVTYCYSPEQFLNSLQANEILNDRTMYIEKYLTFFDGKSGERIIGSIIDIMNRSINDLKPTQIVK